MSTISLGTVWTVKELRELLLPFTDDLKLENGTSIVFKGEFPDYRLSINDSPPKPSD